MNEKESVCVGVRRGDVFRSQKVFYYSHVCDKEYFLDAINIIKNKRPNAVFVFFSNDIQWCKNEFGNLDIESYYESGSDPVWETFRLMYSCKHFIISNSTLHWWAQYLSSNPDKIVISPDRWLNNVKNYDNTLLEDYFIKCRADA
jgi:hypothetical protein